MQDPKNPSLSNKTSKKPYGIIAEFANPHDLLKAASSVQKEGYKQFDAHSPFPVHGMDEAMNLKDSTLGWIVALGALVGFVGALFLQIWTMTTAYPFVISGKPFNSLEAFVPVTFELTVLFSAFAATFGMIALNKLPQWYHPLFKASRFPLASSHSFFISIQATDTLYDTSKTSRFLKQLGSTHIEEVHE